MNMQLQETQDTAASCSLFFPEGIILIAFVPGSLG